MHVHARARTHTGTSKRPTLSQLQLLKSPSGQRVEVISTIAAKWERFGNLLGFDEMGHTLERIAKDHPQDAEGCCTQMMREWLEGKGRQPATWAILIDLLKDAKINYLAQELETMVLEKNTAAVNSERLAVNSERLRGREGEEKGWEKKEEGEVEKQEEG